MKRVFASIVLLAIGSLAGARPVPITPTVIPLPPDYYPYRAAVEGSWLAVSAFANQSEDVPGTLAVFLYRRDADGNWVFNRTLAEQPHLWEWWNPTDVPLVAEFGIIAASFAGDLRVFERGASGYTESDVQLPTGIYASGDLIQVDGQRILIGRSCDDAAVLEKNGAGVWVLTGNLDSGTDDGCDEWGITGGMDFSGDFALISSRFQGGAAPTNVFKRVPGQIDWQRLTQLPANDSLEADADTPVTLLGPMALLAGRRDEGVRVFRRTDGGGTLWNRVGTLQPLDLFRSFEAGFARTLRQRGDLALFNKHVYQQQPDNSYVHRAVLDGFQEFDTLEEHGDLDARTAVALRGAEVLVYALPASYDDISTRWHDDFEGGNDVNWQFTRQPYVATRSGNTRVFRQSSTAGDNGALVAGSDWPNQSIEADLTPVQLGGAGSWVGLVVRWIDDANYYSVRHEQNRVALFKRVNGVDTLLDSAPASLVPGTMRRVRLEARDRALVVTYNRAEILRAEDRLLTHGASGVYTSAARADVDNVVVSPLATALYEPFGSVFWALSNWRIAGGAWAAAGSGDSLRSIVLRQNSTSVPARALTGAPSTTDQVIDVRFRIAALGGGADRWAGVVLRYRDNANLYYASLRAGNLLQIRRVLNGSSLVLASVPVPVVVNRMYDLRFEAIGDRLRVYLDHTLRAEVRDTTLPSGRFGLATNRAAAVYAWTSAWQP